MDGSMRLKALNPPERKDAMRRTLIYPLLNKAFDVTREGE